MLRQSGNRSSRFIKSHRHKEDQKYIVRKYISALRFPDDTEQEATYYANQRQPQCCRNFFFLPPSSAQSNSKYKSCQVYDTLVIIGQLPYGFMYVPIVQTGNPGGQRFSIRIKRLCSLSGACAVRFILPWKTFFKKSHYIS